MVGAWYEDEDEFGENYMENSGSVYVFYKNEGVWEETQKLTASDRNIQDVFGLYISISGDYAIINSYNDDEDADGENFLDLSGSAYIYYNNAGTWEEIQKIVASDRAEGDLFSRTVAIDGNRIIAGAYGKNNFTDKIYFYEQDPVFIKNVSQNNISIYPNPTNGIVNINFAKTSNFGKVKIEITNINGQIIKQLTIDNEQLTIDLNGQEK